jgi:hypothetical protein
MIPGIGRFDPGSFSNGGFEIVIGVGSFAERRDQMLAMYREHHIAPRGMHVTNRAQEVGVAELPEGVEMTMELRQQIAQARAQAGYVPVPIGAKVEEVGVDLREDEKYLDGVVKSPDWGEIGRTMDERLCPMTVVMPRELQCPSPEAASRANRLFWEDFRENPEGVIDLCRSFASSWIPASSKALTFWPPEVHDSFVTAIPYSGREGERVASLEHYTFSEIITPAELKDRGLTFRNWFANTLCASIVETLDRRIARCINDWCLGVEVDPCLSAEDMLKHVRGVLGGDPVAWLMDAKAQERLDMVPGQIIENIPGSQAICDDPYPLPEATILARADKPGLHLELPDAYEVEIEPDESAPDALRVTVGYWNAMDVDPDAPSFALIHIGD